MNILYFDTETSGLPQRTYEGCGATHNPKGNPKTVQIGWILRTEDGATQENSIIIRPEGFSIPECVSAIHGITTEKAEKEGVSRTEAMKLFCQALEKADTLCGHNLAFDRKVMEEELENNGFANQAQRMMSLPWEDTMLASTDWCRIPGYRGMYKWPKLIELYTRLFGKPFEGAHDAMADIRATMECHQEMKRRNLM